MFVLNRTGKPIKDISFEGYWFTLPAGCSLVWEPFGKWVVAHYGLEGSGKGGLVPPVLEASSGDWDGKTFADVRRFEINSSYIPARNDLLKIAKSRGIDSALIESWKEDEQIDNKEIADTINRLDVPEHVKRPSVPEAGAPKKDVAQEAMDQKQPEQAATPAAEPKPAPPKGARLPASRTPRTPRRVS